MLPSLFPGNQSTISIVTYRILSVINLLLSLHEFAFPRSDRGTRDEWGSGAGGCGGGEGGVSVDVAECVGVVVRIGLWLLVRQGPRTKRFKDNACEHVLKTELLKELHAQE